MAAALVGVWVAAARILSEGPTITIVFRSAEGLEAGKTKVHYNGVELGTIETIRLSDNHDRVVTSVAMAPKTEDYLSTTRSSGWCARDLGRQHHRSRHAPLRRLHRHGDREVARAPARVRGAPTPPVVAANVAGRSFVFKTHDLGSLDYGTPLYFRRFPVGEITAYELDPDGRAVTLKAFVKAPYDRFVTTETRFWQASGVDVSLTAAGLNVQTQSALSILVGGVASTTRRPARCAGGGRRHRLHAVRRPRARLRADPRAADLCAHAATVGPRARAGRTGRVPWRSGRRGRRHAPRPRSEDERVHHRRNGERVPGDVRRRPHRPGEGGWHRRPSATRRRARGARPAGADPVEQPPDRRAPRRARLLPDAPRDDGLVETPVEFP